MTRVLSNEYCLLRNAELRNTYVMERHGPVRSHDVSMNELLAGIKYTIPCRVGRENGSTRYIKVAVLRGNNIINTNV